MRHPILRAGILVTLVAFAAAAHADSHAGTAARDPEAARALDAVPQHAALAPTWMTDALIGAFILPADAMHTTVASAVSLTLRRESASRPHQNPAFPAAFVFQSNSALFLAAEWRERPALRHGPGAG